MWKLCIICIDFRIFGALKIRKTLIPDLLILFSRIFQSQHQKVNRSKGSASVLVQVNPLQTGKAKSTEKCLLNSSGHQDPHTVSVHSPDNPEPNEGLPMVFEKTVVMWANNALQLTKKPIQFQASAIYI